MDFAKYYKEQNKEIEDKYVSDGNVCFDKMEGGSEELSNDEDIEK